MDLLTQLKHKIITVTHVHIIFLTSYNCVPSFMQLKIYVRFSYYRITINA